MPWTASGRRRTDLGGRGGRGQAGDGPLLDPALLRQLELLSLDNLGSVLSPLEGEHPGAPGARPGELAGYRAYQPGDDLRLIDWNAYARLDELYVRTSAAHEGMLLTLLVDCSRSMAVPGAVGAVPPLLHAKRLAAAFGAVALLHSDAVRVCALADGTAWPAQTLSGRAAVGRLLSELSRLPAGDRTDLAGSLRACLPAGARGLGPVVLLSDLLVPGSQVDALGALGPAGAVLHVTDAAGADLIAAAFPGGRPGRATVELRDGETGEVVTVTAGPELRRDYERLSRAREAALAALCASAGLRYIPAGTATPVADVLFGHAELPVRFTRGPR
jgi:uncharacterized protein (DUF58 family)